jgi:hypothetical protein
MHWLSLLSKRYTMIKPKSFIFQNTKIKDDESLVIFQIRFEWGCFLVLGHTVYKFRKQLPWRNEGWFFCGLIFSFKKKISVAWGASIWWFLSSSVSGGFLSTVVVTADYEFWNMSTTQGGVGKEHHKLCNFFFRILSSLCKIIFTHAVPCKKNVGSITWSWTDS